MPHHSPDHTPLPSSRAMRASPLPHATNQHMPHHSPDHTPLPSPPCTQPPKLGSRERLLLHARSSPFTQSSSICAMYAASEATFARVLAAERQVGASSRAIHACLADCSDPPTPSI